MNNLQGGEVWEIWSPNERRWVRAIVMKVEDGEATLRYEGLLELVTIGVSDLQSKPERFRPAEAAGSSW